MNWRAALGAVMVGAAPVVAWAQDMDFGGYVDARVTKPPKTQSWADGGLGKLWNDSDGNSGGAKPEFQALMLYGGINLPEDLRITGDFRYDTYQKTAFDVLDAYIRWRPVSTTAWRWSVKAGAFFPPISLENDNIGWSSPWTLTSSAINSWVGEELRTIGGEAALEWRGALDHLTITGALFGWNDPAGVELADHGWDFNSRPTGLFDHLEEPDAIALQQRHNGDLYTQEFLEIDQRPGWYGSVSWDRAGIGKVSLLRYDNEANPSAFRHQFAWATDFWSLGVSSQAGEFTFLAQAMSGTTVIAPTPFPTSTTNFQAAYLLAGWQRNDWRVAFRVDKFGTDNHHTGTSADLSEHGSALTFAVNCAPRNWLLLTAEILTVDSWRTQRLVEGQAPRAIETEPQLGAKVSF